MARQAIKISRLTVKGQITLPKALRDTLGWTPHTRLTFVREKDGIKIVAAKTDEDIGEAFVRRFRGSQRGKFTTDEIMAMTRGED
jgi:AbrB family looped-hinge helix DNA binding protein